jgi:hypothetical protein
VRLEPGRCVGDVPLGLFYRVEMVVFGPRRVDAKTWLFLPGQRVSRVYPYGGTGAFDPSGCSGDTCGSYEISGGKLIVRWDGGRVMGWTFAASAEGINLDGVLYRPARPMSEAALAGRWADDSASNVYTFDSNGVFTFGADQGGLGGTYRAQGFTLTLTFADGGVRHRTMFAASATEPAGMISVEGEVYARQQ